MAVVSGAPPVAGAVSAEREHAEPVRLSQADRSEVARGTLPPGAAPGPIRCVLAAGGLVYVTDGVGSVLTVQP